MAESRKIAAILVSDVVGYSRLAGADEDRTLSRLRGLRGDLIDPAIAAHHGRIVKRTGDGSLVEFRSVVDAVRCAIEVQNGMIERNTGLPQERRIDFRIGIHLGDVVEESDGDLMGDGVNIAARLESIAEPGAICLSEDAYRQVKGRLDLAVTDLGPTHLKNIAEPIRIYSLQVGIPAVAKPANEAKPPEPKRRSIPIPLVAGIAALLIVIASSLWYVLAPNRAAPVAASARLSIIVLPFANLSGDAAQDYLADALTDQLTTSLARIKGSFVIARNTAFTYKGKPVDAKAIGKDLGVRYVMEGSVQPSGAEVRVNAQLIDADTGAHLWAEQFDTPRADLLRMQDEIVTHLARALELQLPEAEAAHADRAPVTNANAEDLALQCIAAEQKGGYIGKEAEPGFLLCEKALAADPNNVRALAALAVKFWLPAGLGLSADPKGDFKRADDLLSKALALDPNWAVAHMEKANILLNWGRFEEAITENKRAIALDPAMVDAVQSLGVDYLSLGEFETSVEYEDKAIRLSPHDPNPGFWDMTKGEAYFGLKQYDQAIESARKSIAINPNYVPFAHGDLIAALVLTGRGLEAREALERYLALPSPALKTVAAWRAYRDQNAYPHTDPRYLESFDRLIEGLRKAGMPEQ